MFHLSACKLAQYGECARFSYTAAVISASTASTAGNSLEKDAAGIAGMTLSISPASKIQPCDSEAVEIAAASGGWSAQPHARY